LAISKSLHDLDAKDIGELEAFPKDSFETETGIFVFDFLL